MSLIMDMQNKNLPAECYVFKHSTACPISARAAGAVRGHAFSMPLYWINVIAQRNLSSWVAAEYEVPHESPQLIEIRNGKTVRVLNHGAITADGM